MHNTADINIKIIQVFDHTFIHHGAWTKSTGRCDVLPKERLEIISLKAAYLFFVVVFLQPFPICEECWMLEEHQSPLFP